MDQEASEFEKTRENLRRRLEALAPVAQKYGYRDLSKDIPVRVRPEILLVTPSPNSPPSSELLYTLRQEFSHFDWLQEESEDPVEIMLAITPDAQIRDLRRLMEGIDQRLTMRLEKFVGYHQRRLSLIVQALSNFSWKQRMFALQWGFVGFLGTFCVGLLVGVYIHYVTPFGPVTDREATLISLGVSLVAYAVWWVVGYKISGKGHFKKNINEMDRFVKLSTREEGDIWQDIKPLVIQYLNLHGRAPRITELRSDRNTVL